MRGMLAKGLAVTTSSVLLGGNAENNILAILRACLFPFVWVLCRAACAGPIHSRSPVSTPPPRSIQNVTLPQIRKPPTVGDLFLFGI